MMIDSDSDDKKTIDKKLESLAKSLKHPNYSLTIHKYSKENNLTLRESTKILNKFIAKYNILLDNSYVVFFQIELNAESEITKIIISNESDELQSLLSNDNLLSISVYAIVHKSKEFTLNDYSILCGEEKVIDKLDVKNLEKASKVFHNLNVDIKEEPKPKNIITKIDKPNEIKENEEENYYGGFKPNKLLEAQMDIEEENNNENIDNIDNNDNNDEDNDVNMKDEVKEDSKINENNSNDFMPDDNIKEGFKKVKKIKQEKRTETYLDKDGYLVTKDVIDKKEDWELEKIDEGTKRKNINSQTSPQKKTKKPPKGQTTLFNYMKKK